MNHDTAYYKNRHREIEGENSMLKPWEIVVDALYDVDEVTYEELQEICRQRGEFAWREKLGHVYCTEFPLAIEGARGLGFIEIILGRDERFRISEDGKTVVEHWREK